jgi:hypothetical protein
MVGCGTCRTQQPLPNPHAAQAPHMQRPVPTPAARQIQKIAKAALLPVLGGQQ